MDKRIYIVSPWTWLISLPFLLLATFCVLLFVMLTPSILMIDNPFIVLFLFLGIIFLAFFVVYAALLFFDIPTMRLEVSDEGVILYSNGYRIYTPWQNIVGAGWLQRDRSFPSILQFQEPAVVGEISFEEGIASRRAVTEKRRWWMLNRQLKAEDQYTHYIRIPVMFFRKKDKQDGSINRYLRYYLPHLMESR